MNRHIHGRARIRHAETITSCQFLAFDVHETWMLGDSYMRKTTQASRVLEQMLSTMADSDYVIR